MVFYDIEGKATAEKSINDSSWRMKTEHFDRKAGNMAENRQLTNAKSAKNDEFYTQYADIQKEVNA